MMMHKGTKYYIAGGGYYMDSKGNYLHHKILPKKSGYVVDHINRDKLDNRPSNLRYLTEFQNTINRSAKNDLGIKNVHIDNQRKLSKPYRVLFHIGGKNYCFGRHEDLSFAKHLAEDINCQLL
jgi:hypothetical protein